MKKIFVFILFAFVALNYSFANPDSAFYPTAPPNGFQNVGVSTALMSAGNHVYNIDKWITGKYKFGTKIYLVGTFIGSEKVGNRKLDGKPVYAYAIYITGWNGYQFTQVPVWFYSISTWHPRPGWLIGFYGKFLTIVHISGYTIPVYDTFGAQVGMQPVPMLPVLK